MRTAGSKKRSKKKVATNTGKSSLGTKAIEDIAARSMASLVPGFEAGAHLPDDFDEKYDLIYAAVNQAVTRFKEGVGDFHSPVEMRVSIEHDSNIKRNEIGFNFRSSKFTLYTNLSDRELDKPVFDPISNKELSRADQLGYELSKIIPSAQLKFFTTQAEIMSLGQEGEYKKNYLPKQFTGDKDSN